ncbi:MAG: hypothetical protein OXH01_05800 [Bacteroidetes bacterium]|nr:hypothetical protein [Bacteroidota bacterium]
MNSKTVDLIATDPSFHSKSSYDTPLGSKEAKQEFEDCWRWNDVEGEWSDLIASADPSIKEIVEAAVLIERRSVELRTGKAGTDMRAVLIEIADTIGN